MSLRVPRHPLVGLSILAASCATRIPPPPASHAAATPAIAAPRPVPASPAPASPAEPPPEQPLANLKLLAHHLDPSPLYWSFGEDVRMLSMPAAAAQQLGATNHIRLPAQLRGHRPWLWIGDVVLLLHRASQRVVAVDPRTLAVRWRVDASWSIAATPRMLIVKHTDALVGHALGSGREVWRSKLGHVDDLWTDGARILAWDSLHLHAFDADTGARSWGPLAVPSACGWTADSGVLVVETESGYRVIDTASGATLRTLGGPGLCRWNNEYRPGFVRGVVGGGALVVVEPRVSFEGERVAPTVLRSYDLATGAERWTRPRDELHLVAAHRDAVYAVHDDTWYALDAANGQAQARLTLASVWLPRRDRGLEISSDVQAPGPLLFLDSDDGKWVVGRGPEPTPLEAFEIHGRILASPGLDPRWLRDLPIEVSGQLVRTDDAGRFTARGAAAGQLRVSLAGDNQLADNRWSANSKLVMLDGSGTYPVALEAYKLGRGGGGGTGRWLPHVNPRRSRW